MKEYLRILLHKLETKGFKITTSDDDYIVCSKPVVFGNCYITFNLKDKKLGIENIDYICSETLKIIMSICEYHGWFDE